MYKQQPKLRWSQTLSALILAVGLLVMPLAPPTPTAHPTHNNGTAIDNPISNQWAETSPSELGGTTPASLASDLYSRFVAPKPVAAQSLIPPNLWVDGMPTPGNSNQVVYNVNIALTASGKLFGTDYPSLTMKFWCYDMTTGTSCTGYPFQHDYYDYPYYDPTTGQAFTGIVQSRMVAIGERVYFLVGGPEADFPVTNTYIFCWDVSTRSTCGESPEYSIGAGLALIDGKLYTHSYAGGASTNPEIHCYDPDDSLNSCPGYPAAGDMSLSSSRPFTILQTVGSRLYIAGGGYITCFDTSTSATCSGWPVGAPIYIPDVVPASIGITHHALVARTNVNGVVDGICSGGWQSGTNNASNPIGTGGIVCFDLDGSDPLLIQMGVYQRASNSSAMNLQPFGTRVFWLNRNNPTIDTVFDDKVTLQCWDWATNANCTGNAYTNGAITMESYRAFHYSTVSDGACLYITGPRDETRAPSLDPDYHVHAIDPHTGEVCSRAAADNNAPSAVNDTATTPSETALNGDASTNDSDPDGDSLLFAKITDPANGTVTVNPDGSYVYTSNAGFSGTDSFTYRIDDLHGSTDTATVTINVTVLDTTPPAVTISGQPASHNGSSPFTANINFDEDVTGFDASDVNATNGTVDSITGGPQNYLATITPSGTSDVTISVPANVAQDGTGNPNTASNSVSVPYVAVDTTPPARHHQWAASQPQR